MTQPCLPLFGKMQRVCIVTALAGVFAMTSAVRAEPTRREKEGQKARKLIKAGSGGLVISLGFAVTGALTNSTEFAWAGLGSGVTSLGLIVYAVTKSDPDKYRRFSPVQLKKRISPHSLRGKIQILKFVGKNMLPFPKKKRGR